MTRAGAYTTALALGSLLGFAGAAWWPLDLFTHFKLHYVLLAAPVAVWCTARRDWGTGLIAWLVVALNAGFLVPLVGSGPPAPEGARRLRVFVANLNQDNLAYADIARAIVDSDADVVGLVEVGDRGLEELRRPLEPWPHRVEHPRPDYFGLALYSKHRVVIDDVIPQPVTEAPTLRAVLEVAGERVQFVLVHLPPPINADWSAARDGHLAQLAKMREGTTGRLVLMGDFNATPWSQGFRAAVRTAGFHRAGTGIGGTWPAPLGRLGIPIDHVLLHGPITAVEARVGPDIGSDHLPVVAELALLDAQEGT